MQASGPQRWDVIVAGLGAMGSAACDHLARRGLRVLGLDRSQPGHARNASAGGSRAFRMAYFQHDDYVALARRAEGLWQELDAQSPERLFDQTGGVLLAPESHPVTEGVLASADRHGLEVNILSDEEQRATTPGLAKGPGEVALFERRAGLLWSERCDAAHRDRAKRAGAVFEGRRPVMAVDASATEVRIETAAGELVAEQLVVATGAWAASEGGAMLGAALPLEVRRQVQWDLPADEALWADAGVWNVAPAGVRHSFYGTGLRPGGFVTVGQHHGGGPSDADDTRGPSETERSRLRRFVSSRLEGVGVQPVAERVGRYTCTPDRAPLIGRCNTARGRADERVVLACGFSGHGYKFASAVGAVVAELVADGRSESPLEAFDPCRFALAESAAESGS